MLHAHLFLFYYKVCQACVKSFNIRPYASDRMVQQGWLMMAKYWLKWKCCLTSMPSSHPSSSLSSAWFLCWTTIGARTQNRKNISLKKGNISSAILTPKKLFTSKYFMITISKTGIYLYIQFIYLQACSKNSHSFEHMHADTDPKFTNLRDVLLFINKSHYDSSFQYSTHNFHLSQWAKEIKQIRSRVKMYFNLLKHWKIYK